MPDLSYSDELIEVLRNGKQFSLVPHEKPDADALGSTLGLALALANAGKQVRVLVGDVIKQSLTFLPGFAELTVSHSANAIAYLDQSDVVLICDTHEPTLLGRWIDPLMHVIETGLSNVRVIDHHLPRHESIFPAGWIDPTISSTAEMVLILLEKGRWPINHAIAQNLMAGIMWDTSRFTNANTRPQTLLNASTLINYGADVVDINGHLFSLGTADEVRLRGELFESIHLDFEGRYVWVIVTPQMLSKYGVSESAITGLGNDLRLIEGVKVAAVLFEYEPNSTRVSLRSRGGYEVQQIAEQYPGGGGHSVAAGCQIELGAANAAIALKTKIEALFV